jgi:hypothetical protein
LRSFDSGSKVLSDDATVAREGEGEMAKRVYGVEAGTVARIEYTVEVRGEARRRAKEVLLPAVERTIDKLVEKGAFNFDVKYGVAS